MQTKDINDVKLFLEENPLFQGESAFEAGSQEFFDEHRRVYIEDCFAGFLDQRLFPESPDGLVLDLGSGPCFWSIEFLTSGKAKNIVAADLTKNALQIGRKRFAVYNVRAKLVQANAETLPFASNSFDHVSCLGVIHHTPETERCVAEIARILKPGGKSVISVYYENVILRNWSKLRFMGRFIARFGGKMPGRGREGIFFQDDVNEIVRMYDGSENPLGKAYRKSSFVDMLCPYFRIEEIFFHFFPARALPRPLPRMLHQWLDRALPFMIYAKVRKDF